MIESITKAMEAVMRASGDVSRDDFELQARLLRAFDLLAEARRVVRKRAGTLHSSGERSLRGGGT